MPELRHDELTGALVLYAPARAARPHTFPPEPRDARSSTSPDCPFCPGHEAMTPPEVFRLGKGDPDKPGWRVRVAPNLYPIVGEPDARPGATGAHEVAVLSPAHDRSFARLDAEQAFDVVAVLRARARHHLEKGRAFVQLVINHGAAAGASISHPHAQIVALDFVPPAVLTAIARTDEARRDLVESEASAAVSAGLTVVEGEMSVWCPSASVAPYEVRVAGHRCGAHFEDADDDELHVLADALRDVLARLAAVLGDAPYNLVVHGAPPGPQARWFHWYIEIQPRIAITAGFEQGTGVMVNDVLPETAADRLRAAAQ
jgi:UDPglucose--hexose-1-phosphate uridylyltransferase